MMVEGDGMMVVVLSLSLSLIGHCPFKVTLQMLTLTCWMSLTPLL